MLNKFRKLINYIKGLYPKSAFRLVSVTGEANNKNLSITYQVRGKSTVVTEKPNVLINELMVLNGFCKEDADLIYQLALTEKMSPLFRIISVIFNDEITQFEIEDIHTRLTLNLSAEEIVSSSNMMSNFSSNDVTKIYFQLLNEKEKENFRLKKQNTIEYENLGKVFVLKRPETH